MAEWSKAVSRLFGRSLFLKITRNGENKKLFFLLIVPPSLSNVEKNEITSAAGFKSLCLSLPSPAEGENTGLVRGVGSKPTGCIYFFAFFSSGRGGGEREKEKKRKEGEERKKKEEKNGGTVFFFPFLGRLLPQSPTEHFQRQAGEGEFTHQARAREVSSPHRRAAAVLPTLFDLFRRKKKRHRAQLSLSLLRNCQNRDNKGPQRGLTHTHTKHSPLSLFLSKKKSTQKKREKRKRKKRLSLSLSQTE